VPSERDEFGGGTAQLKYRRNNELRAEIVRAVGGDYSRYETAEATCGLCKADLVRIADTVTSRDEPSELTLRELYDALDAAVPGMDHSHNAGNSWGISREDLKALHRAVHDESQLVTDGGSDVCKDGTDRSAINAGLVSGGEDSTVSAKVADDSVGLDLLVYLDTGTGLTENREYIESLADRLGLQLWTLRTHESYEEKVREHGFPGPSRHGMMYTSLKERQLDKLATVCSGFGNAANLHLWTGVRSSESERRMAHVEPVQEADRWTWHAPIHDWSKQKCREYIEKNDLPENPIWDELGRSGDCFCGCFGNPTEKIDLLAGGYESHAEWIETLEETAREVLDIPDERSVWGWAALSESEQRAVAAELDPAQMPLCSGCGYDFSVVTDGGNSRSVDTGTDYSGGEQDAE